VPFGSGVCGGFSPSDHGRTFINDTFKYSARQTDKKSRSLAHDSNESAQNKIGRVMKHTTRTTREDRPEPAVAAASVVAPRQNLTPDLPSATPGS
jgi:hypothetical protein